MQKKAYVIWIYSVILLIGGSIGFLKAGSFVSLVMALFFSLAFINFGWSMRKGNEMAFSLTVVLLIVLEAFFGYRFFTSLKMLPSGMMAIVTLVILTYFLVSKNAVERPSRS